MRMQKRIIKKILMRSGLYDGKIYTLEEIARPLGITRERVRQVQVKAARKIKKAKLIAKKE